MRIEQLEYFIALTNKPTIHAVAEQFYTSSQVVSAAIKQLEKELNCELFFRTKKGLTLTPNGRAIYSHVKEILYHYQEIYKTLIPPENTEKEIFINILSQRAMSHYFSNLFKNYSVTLPDSKVVFSLNIQYGSEICDVLQQENNYDIIAYALPTRDYENFIHNYYIKYTYQVFELHKDRAKLWVSKENFFASAGSIKVDELTKIPLIEYSNNENDIGALLKKQIHYSYYFSDYYPAFDLLKSNAAGLFATENFVLNAFPPDILKVITGLSLDEDISFVTVLFVKKKKLSKPYFSSIVHKIVDYVTN